MACGLSGRFLRRDAEAAEEEYSVLRDYFRLQHFLPIAIRRGLIILSVLFLLICCYATAAAITPAGTAIDNYATLQYADTPMNSNVVRITVAQAAGITLVSETTPLAGPQGKTLYFPVSLTNTGNGSDSFSLTATAQSGWPVSIIRDDNSDGIHQDGEQTSMADSGSVVSGGQARFFAALTIPAGASNGTQSALTVAARSDFDTTVSAGANFTAVAQTTIAIGLSPTQGLVTASTGSKAYVSISVANLGNIQDSFALSAACDNGWGVAIIDDVNQDGIHQSTETTRLTSSGPLAPNAQKRFFIETQVPEGLSAETQGNVQLTVASAQDATKTAQGAYTVVGKVLAAGDLDGDGSITAQDVQTAAQMAVGGGNWSAAQLLRADTNGDGVVDIADVIRIQNLSNGQPILSLDVVSGGRQLSLPNVMATAGATKMISLDIDQGASVSGMQATILTDGSLLNALEVVPDALMGAGANWQIIYATAPGEVHLLAYNTAGGSLAAGSGGALRINMAVAAAALPGDATPLVWAEAKLSDPSGTAIAPVAIIDGALAIEAGWPLAVKVTNSAGTTPIVGALVEAWQNGGLIASEITDSSGNVSLYPLADGVYDIRVSAAGYYTETYASVAVGEGQNASIGFDLLANSRANTGAIEGIVVNSAGTPLKRAKVSFYLNGRRTTSIYTNSAGYYYKALLNPGSYTVTAQLSSYSTATATVVVKANELSESSFILASSNTAKTQTRNLLSHSR